ncbi:hypothetical protein GQ600_2691 [Phytophthora cactorum]|nr:hypothetical protein GQ600_2691 [Phytophthora cactorum]
MPRRPTNMHLHSSGSHGLRHDISSRSPRRLPFAPFQCSACFFAAEQCAALAADAVAAIALRRGASVPNLQLQRPGLRANQS